MTVRLLTATLVIVVTSLLLVPVAAPATTAPKPVTVTMKEFKFVFSSKSVTGGPVAFKLVNKGALPHDLKIGGKTSALIKAGKSGTFKVTLKKGKLAFVCTVAGHAAAGMKGTLTVK